VNFQSVGLSGVTTSRPQPQRTSATPPPSGEPATKYPLPSFAVTRNGAPGAPVYGPGNATAQQLGLNIPAVTKALRRVTFPEETCGAGHLRWPKGLAPPNGLELPFGVMALMKQTLRMEQAVWSEGPVTLQCFVVPSHGDVSVVDGAERAALLRGIFKGTVPTRSEEGTELIEKIAKAEESVVNGSS